jgi:hypothetical protein
MVFIGCEKKEPVQQKEHKSKEEIFLKMQEEDKKFHQTISERKVKYKDMLSVNRGSGDIGGIWYMKGDDIENMKNFLSTDLKPSMGYCIEISDNLKKGRIYFTVTDKVFDVDINKISEYKYEMIYGTKKRIFEVMNLEHPLYKGSKDLIWFFEDSHKYNPQRGSDQLNDGINYYDFCTSGRNEYDCTVQGCLGNIKESDEISDEEIKNQPLGVQ